MAAALAVWWLFFSKLPWISRVWGLGCQGLFFGVAYLAGAQVGELDGPADVCHARRAERGRCCGWC